MTEKVSSNITNEASYVCILNWEKLIEKCQKFVHFGEFLKICSLRSISVTRQVTFNKTKIGGKCQNSETSNATFWVIFKQCESSEIVVDLLSGEFFSCLGIKQCLKLPFFQSIILQLMIFGAKFQIEVTHQYIILSCCSQFWIWLLWNYN